MKSLFKTQQYRDEFNKYLKALTDRQVINVFHKEKKAGRKLEAGFALREIERRGILHIVQEH